MKLVFLEPYVMTWEVLHGPAEPPKRTLFDPKDPHAPAESLEYTRHTVVMHTIVLTTQAIRVGYDPHADTLYVGEILDQGSVARAARDAYWRGDKSPFLAELARENSLREYAESSQSRSLSHLARVLDQRQREQRVTVEATERLKSRKPGVRRRARRLLERLAASKSPAAW